MSTTEVLTESATSKYVQTTKWKLHYNEAGDGHPLRLRQARFRSSVRLA
ncbi:hypothetical protein [Streptomyces ureilyticus]|uniref:Uncharacterized protein n=1 Tax=Streptomyces ureilyticus TaxID=1775131 RepID=A0ABX0DY84_9ACTN|nr:hypothetical protein [Streptomyces ureilyticus]NGO45605.1 hypothetical protein [Streptomyces ureilyticus]